MTGAQAGPRAGAENRGGPRHGDTGRDPSRAPVRRLLPYRSSARLRGSRGDGVLGTGPRNVLVWRGNGSSAVATSRCEPRTPEMCATPRPHPFRAISRRISTSRSLRHAYWNAQFHDAATSVLYPPADPTRAVLDTLRADSAGWGSREAVTQGERCPPAPMGPDREGALLRKSPVDETSRSGCGFERDAIPWRSSV